MFHQDNDPEKVAASNCCIQLTSQPTGPGFQILWGAERANSYYSSPLAFAGFVYYVNKAGVLYCIDQESGKQVYAKRIGNPCWASAIGVAREDGERRVYFFMKNGSSVVLRPGPTYDQVARNQLWSAEQFLLASETAKRHRLENRIPPQFAKPKQGPEKMLAGLPEQELHEMFSYSDPTVYAASVAGDSLLVRTGQQVFCVRKSSDEAR